MRKEIIKIFKSGEFSIIYWDNQTPSIYSKSGLSANDFSEDDEKYEVEFNDWGTGYLPEIVELLVKALGGTSDSI